MADKGLLVKKNLLGAISMVKPPDKSSPEMDLQKQNSAEDVVAQKSS